MHFAHPHRPWERGINENTNGLLRQYLPRGEYLSFYTQEDLEKIELRLNTRPRKSLAWKCPAELSLPIVAQKLSRIGVWGGSDLNAIQRL